MIPFLDTHALIYVFLLPLMGSMLCLICEKHIKAVAGFILALTLLAEVELLFQLSSRVSVAYTPGGWPGPLGIELSVNRLSMIFLAMTGIVMTFVGAYASFYFSDSLHGQSTDTTHSEKNRPENKQKTFWMLAFLVWAGINALYISADLFNIYIALELIGISAVAAVNVKSSAATLKGSMQYLLVNLMGSMFYLLGVVIIYKTYGSLSLALIAQHFSVNYQSIAALIAILLGLSFKGALFPFHFWLRLRLRMQAQQRRSALFYRLW